MIDFINGHHVMFHIKSALVIFVFRNNFFSSFVFFWLLFRSLFIYLGNPLFIACFYPFVFFTFTAVSGIANIFFFRVPAEYA
jgi:hypothetical protein